MQQDRVLSSISGSSHPDRVSRSSDEPSTAESLSARTATELTSRDHQPDATVPPSNDPAKATAPTSIRNLGTDISVPATKRRRVIGPEDSRRSATRPETHAPILSTETAHDGIEARAANVTSKQRTTITKKSAPTKGRRKIEAPVVVIDAEDPRGSKVGTTKRRTRIKKGAKIVELDEAEAPLQPSDVSQGPETQEHTPARAEGQKVLSRGKRKNAIQDAAADIVADAVKTSPKGLKRIRRKAGRVATPGDDINVGIAPSEVKMMDLCKDSGIGKLSERETWLREYERAEFVKKKQRELQDIMESSKSNAQTGSAEAAQSSSNPDDGQQAQEEEVTLNVPNTIIVNGQIQIDENSLQIDRHAAAAAERNAEQLSVVEENPYTRKINSGTWLKRDKSGGWNELLIDRLYEGLRMFGTDFQMISKMFPGKTRHSVKLRFCKEEKTNYSRIEAALSGDMVHVDLDKYQAMTGTEYGDPEDLEKEIADDRKRLEQEQAAEKEAMDAAGRERDEQIAAERAKATEESSIGNVGRKKRKRRGIDGRGRTRHEETASRG